MRTTKMDQLSGLVFGSFVADALALGAHWIYDQDELQHSFGRITDFLTPRKNSYHPHKHAGEQTHYGDQALILLDSLAVQRRYDHADFAQRWQHLWVNYPDYIDQATKDTLKNLEKGIPHDQAASSSEELGGAARLAPLLGLLADASLENSLVAARQQTALTHESPIALDSAEFLTRIVHAVLNGEEIKVAIDCAANANYTVLSPQEMLDRVAATQALSVREATFTLGLSCPVVKALPTTIALLMRFPDDLEAALIENVMAGGDSAVRGLAVGMILGARHGKNAIPERWINNLKNTSRITAFLEKLSK